MDTVYIETTVVGNIAGRIHPHPEMAARQRKTRKWWNSAPSRFRLLISQLVLDECSDGDASAAQERIDEVSHLPRLDITENAHALAEALITAKVIPASEPRDALHIAIAATNCVQYLVTWNFKHIANATLRQAIGDVCRANGFEPPIICTPEEIAGMTDDSPESD